MYEHISADKPLPAYEEMAGHCGAAAALFTTFNHTLSHTWGTEQLLRNPYGKKYGWGVDHRIRGKHLCDVFPEAGAFTLMIRMSNAQFETVYPRLSPYAQELCDNKYPCGDGGWVHLRVRTQGELEDALLLMQAKTNGAPRGAK